MKVAFITFDKFQSDLMYVFQEELVHQVMSTPLGSLQKVLKKHPMLEKRMLITHSANPSFTSHVLCVLGRA